MLNRINTAAEFVVRYSEGREQSFDYYYDAIQALVSQGCQVVGHSGDLEDGGDRTLAWKTEDDAENDDGARAFATITGRY